jgi:hypothetical protein
LGFPWYFNFYIEKEDFLFNLNISFFALPTTQSANEFRLGTTQDGMLVAYEKLFA